MKADFLIADASNDNEREPTVVGTLKHAFEQAKLKAEIEVYADTMHGWCPPDSAVYNKAQAEKAWSRLLVLLEGALKA